jgi:hypothetical protein
MLTQRPVERRRQDRHPVLAALAIPDNQFLPVGKDILYPQPQAFQQA